MPITKPSFCSAYYIRSLHLTFSFLRLLWVGLFLDRQCQNHDQTLITIADQSFFILSRSIYLSVTHTMSFHWWDRIMRIKWRKIIDLISASHRPLHFLWSSCSWRWAGQTSSTHPHSCSVSLLDACLRIRELNNLTVSKKKKIVI